MGFVFQVSPSQTPHRYSAGSQGTSFKQYFFSLSAVLVAVAYSLKTHHLVFEMFQFNDKRKLFTK